MPGIVSVTCCTGAGLDLERMALGVEHVLIKADNRGIGEHEVEVLQDFGEEETTHARKQG
jgi:hypothetical protein